LKYEVLIVGRGGQGVLLLGRIMGLAASKYAGLYAVVTETYAAETRGGESRSDVVIASSMEEAPYVRVLKPDIAVFMYPYRLDYYKKILGENTLVVVDEEYVEPSVFQGNRLITFRFSEFAEKRFNTRRVANIVILGRILREINVLKLDHVKSALEELIPGKWLPLNLQALEEGYRI
jgi:2-oxoglutarate ferredoxin oxidoreductase subunit gamma